MKEKVAAVLAQIRPALQSDGGDVELVDVNEGIVRLNSRVPVLGARWQP
jgi:Fe-S cluster biogenesis protein NfuA